MVVDSKPSTQQIWDWLKSVPDPEIPVISVVDLGIVRDVEWQGNTICVTITPTYSGCPATSIINLDIETALRSRGLDQIELKQQIAPPWTTDWLTGEAREKLEKFGIAPPQATGRPDSCPHCGAAELERISQFGSTPCKAQWRCLTCLEPFDYFKCI